MKRLFMLIILGIFLVACEPINQPNDDAENPSELRCVPGYEQEGDSCKRIVCEEGTTLVGNECEKEIDLAVCDHLQGLIYECEDYLENSIQINESTFNNGLFIPLEGNNIGDHQVYYKRTVGYHCDYFRPVYIVYDYYHTDTTRYGYEALWDGACYVQLYIYNGEDMFSLEEAFTEEIITLTDINSSITTFTIKEQPLYGDIDKSEWGIGMEFGSVIKEYTNHNLDTTIYYYDYTGYTCSLDNYYFVLSWENTEYQTYYENVYSGDYCGSPLLVWYEGEVQSYYRVLGFGNTELTSDELNLIYDSFNSIQMKTTLAWNSSEFEYIITNIDIYDVINEQTRETPLEVTDDFLFAFESNYNNSVFIMDLDETDVISIFNLYQIYHQETNHTYQLDITFSDNSIVTYKLQNGVLYNEIKDEYIFYGYFNFMSDVDVLSVYDDSTYENIEDYIKRQQ